MADDANLPRTVPPPRLAPWLRLVHGLGISFDPKKLILAALGMALLWAGWRGLDQLFRPARPVAGTIGWWGVRAWPLAPSWGGEPSRGLLLRAAARVADPFRALVVPALPVFAVGTGPRAFFHALLATLWGLVVWGLVGGAIARIALVQVAQGERVGIGSALGFAGRKAAALVGAPLVPLVGIGFLAAPCAVVGLLYQIPGPWGATVAGVLAFIPLAFGLVMAIVGVGLAVSWPLMPPAVAAEQEDGFDALSRAFGYAYQRPAFYAATAALAWVLGVVGLFVVGLFARAIVGLAAWGLSWGAPDAQVAGLFLGDPARTATGMPATVHDVWLALVSLLANGWIFSYFWSAASIVYLLLRHEVDGTFLHEVAGSGPERTDLAPHAPTEPTASAQPDSV